MATVEKNHGLEQARAQLASIRKMVNEYLDAVTWSERDEARDNILEDSLSVEVRSDWVSPGQDLSPVEYQVLLCTGGPAVRIVGELDKYLTPETIKLEYQDWFTSWTRYPLSDEEESDVREYVGQLYFGG